MRIIKLGSVLTATALAGLFGCTMGQLGDPMPPVEELDEGINIIEADPSFGVIGAYREGLDVVYFETRVGYTKPQVYREAYPDEPAEEIDMRFLDENGLPFFVQRGGDDFVDPTWVDGINETLTTEVSDVDRELDFALAQAAGQEFPAIVGPDLADHTFHLSAYGARLAPSEDPGLVSATEGIEAIPRPNVSYATKSKSGWWYLAGGMSHSSVYLFGSHGSVAFYAYDTSWKFQLNACNHGSCTGSFKCYSYSNGWKYNPVFNYESSTSTGTVSGGCSTGYDWNGGDNKHNSNDDTAYELWQVVDGTPNTTRGDSVTFDWSASNKRYACRKNGGRWTAPANCPHPNP